MGIPVGFFRQLYLIHISHRFDFVNITILRLIRCELILRPFFDYVKGSVMCFMACHVLFCQGRGTASGSQWAGKPYIRPHSEYYSVCESICM